MILNKSYKPRRPMPAPIAGKRPPTPSSAPRPLNLGLKPVATAKPTITPIKPITTPQPTKQGFFGRGNEPKKLRLMVLGGLEEVGRNMSMLEYGNDIVIIDMGLQFPEENMPGIDYIIPDITYLQDKTKNIRGVIITHGHMDHTGAISHLMPKLGNPTIYTTKLTAGLIKKRDEDFSKMCQLKISLVNPDTDKIKLGAFDVEFFRVNHNIPDAMGVVLNTPVGTIVHTGDFKIDFTPINDQPVDLGRLAQIGSRGVLALMSDSTDAGHKGSQISESEITGDLEEVFVHSKGRILIGTFASLINRIQQILTLSEKYNRKVLLEGRSMNANVEIAKQLGYLKFRPDTIIEDVDFKKYPDNRLVMLGTGAQGEQHAVLMRVAQKEHKYVQIKEGDSVLFSSSVIPGNERTIQTLKDTFYKQGAKVFHYQDLDVHAGGHAKAEDLKLVMRLFKPKYFIPIEANHYMLRLHGELAESVGIPKERILIGENGQVFEFSKQGNESVARLTDEKVPAEYIFVDGLGVGDISHIVLRDRRMMSEDGMFVVIATVRKQNGELVGSPDILSRGFVYMKESKELIEEARNLVKKICQKHTSETNYDAMDTKNKLREALGTLLYKRTERRPMVLPVIIEV